MTIPGVGPFVAVTIKARIGIISRFPDKQKLCSYAGIVPKADNSGEYEGRRGVKRGDYVLKNALTIAVRGAVKSSARTSIKRVYMKAIRRGKEAQVAEVVAARKLADIVWGMLTNREPYREEDKRLTAKKASALKGKFRDKDRDRDRREIVDRLRRSAGTLMKYRENNDYMEGGG
jgi:hypothetical protein